MDICNVIQLEKTKIVNISENIFVKLENFNISGSIKDRIVWWILNKAKKEGKLLPNQSIIEASSGNTGISLATYGHYFKHKVYVVLEKNVTPERKEIIEFLGGNVLYADSDLFLDAIKLRDKFANENNCFILNKFDSQDCIDCHYHTTGKEIIEQIPQVDIFILGAGTGGCIMGVSKRLKEYNPNIKIILVDSSQTHKMYDMFYNINNPIDNQKHNIQGYSKDATKYLLNLKWIDDVIFVSDKEALEHAKYLSSHFNMHVGITSGANYYVAKQFIHTNKNIVTIFCDHGDRYVSLYEIV